MASVSASAQARAQAEKEKGNACFKAGKYADAVGHYTAAILTDVDGKECAFPLNRAAAYLRLGKNEDAERDCTTVLRMCEGNANATATATATAKAKALFRRGQARLAMGRLALAEEDLEQALKCEPASGAVLEELGRVRALLEGEEKKKKKTSKPQSLPVPAPAPAPQRRRVPIKIVDPSPAASTSTPTLSPASLKATPTTASDTLRAVSTRSLKKNDAPLPPATSVSVSVSPTPTSTPTTAPAPPPTSAATPPDPAPAPAHANTTAQTQTQTRTRTFKDAKQARENSRPSRVGGGIFRASGENTIFPVRCAPAVPSAADAEAGAGAERTVEAGAKRSAEVGADARSAEVDAAQPIVPVPPAAPPKTCFDFVRAWEASREIDVRWGLILSVHPSSIPALFKISLEPALLMSILAVFRSVLGAAAAAAAAAAGERARVREYMDAFGQVERFETVVLFLSRAEKALARDVWEALGVRKEDVAESAWTSVWK